MITSSAMPRVCLEDMVGQILITGKITYLDRYNLMLALMADALEEADLLLIDRLLYGVRKGLIAVAE